MKKLIKFLSVALIGAMVVDCGGGGSGSSVSSKVKIITNADAIAYKKKNGEWKSIDVNSGLPNSEGLKEYKVDKYGKYMVALKCSNSESTIFAMGKDDGGNIKYKCHKSGVIHFYSLSGALNDTVTATIGGFVTAIDTIYSFDNSAPFNYSYLVKEGLHDFIAVSFDGASKPARFYIKRAVNITQATTMNISLDAVNSCAVKSKNFNTGNGFRLVYVSKEGTYFTSSLGTKWFYPDCTQDSGDIYILVGKDATGNKISLKTEPFNSMAKADIGVQDVSHINALTQLSYQNSGQISGLSQYSPNANSPKLNMFLIDASNTAGNRYSILLSKNYLGSDAVFDMPKLSSVSGFSGVWDGNNASDVYAFAAMTDKKIGDLLKGKFIHLNEIYTYATNSCKIEFAKQKVK